MAIKQLTILFGNNYELNVPVDEHTRYRMIDGHETMTLAVKQEHPSNSAPKQAAQKEFPWVEEYARRDG